MPHVVKNTGMLITAHCTEELTIIHMTQRVIVGEVIQFAFKQRYCTTAMLKFL